MNLKEMVGIEAASYVKDGMVVGLGTGSTAYYMIEELGRRVKEEGLSITGVPTSWASKKQAEGLGIPIRTIDEVDAVDLTIDGADEISKDYHGIKGMVQNFFYSKKSWRLTPKKFCGSLMNRKWSKHLVPSRCQWK